MTKIALNRDAQNCHPNHGSWLITRIILLILPQFVTIMKDKDESKLRRDENISGIGYHAAT